MSGLILVKYFYFYRLLLKNLIEMGGKASYGIDKLCVRLHEKKIIVL